MERKIDRQENYKQYKRKMNSILFLLIIPAVLMLGSFLILYLGNLVSSVHLGTLYLLLLMAYLILIFALTPKFLYYKMHVNYARLLLNEPKLEKCNKHLFSGSWIDHLKKDGYALVQEDLRHLILCKHHNKLPKLNNSEATLVFLVIAKQDDFDFYGDEVDQGIQAYYMKHEDYEKVIKRITLQFRKYDMINEEAKEEVETAILYEAGKHTLINLTFIYDSKSGLLGLNPGDWYPSKYAYFAFKECKRICDIKD